MDLCSARGLELTMAFALWESGPQVMEPTASKRRTVFVELVPAVEA